MAGTTALKATVATGAPALFKIDFSPVEARDFGVLGQRAPFATTSGVECVSCAHSMVATG